MADGWRWAGGWLNGRMDDISGLDCKHECRGASLAESWMVLDHGIPGQSLSALDVLTGQTELGGRSCSEAALATAGVRAALDRAWGLSG